MSDTSTIKSTPTTVPVTTVTPSSGVTTRGQHQQQQRNNAEQAAIDDSEKPSTTESKRREKDAFKGRVDEMGGHVFQLAAEGAKGNQFTTTLEALSQYATIAYDHAKDLAPLFKSPSSHPIFLEPPDQPPMLVDGVTRADRDHRKYISWKRECETYDARVEALKQNQHKLFAVVLLQCSPNVKSKLENTSGYNIAKEDSDCCWLLDTLRNICHRFEDDQNRFVALIAAKKAVLNYRQSAT